MAMAETETGAGLIPTLEDHLLQLADHEAWLDAQIRELEFATSTQEASSVERDLDPAEERRQLEARIDSLKRELITATTTNSIGRMVVNSAHSYQVMLKSLFNKGDPEEAALAAMIEERDDAVSQYLHIHKELQAVRKEVSATQLQVLDRQDENRKLVQILADETAEMKQTTASKDTSRVVQKIDEDLRNVTVKHNIVSNVLLGLVLESGVDWVNDPHYLDLMLKLKRTSS
ncbi:hypothetical protein BGZ99_006746 [Dissophora globulifera]|uniref:Centromere protein H C-terminal domain-containing protein n=1 Tax=Dissophora globulifera TaxID=979702 RepID=A0A9P6URP3_9FUNG|nr:hypothetical protein BGZ99_006746 [Dissophora globulifera]